MQRVPQRLGPGRVHLRTGSYRNKMRFTDRTLPAEQKQCQPCHHAQRQGDGDERGCYMTEANQQVEQSMDNDRGVLAWVK